MNEKEDEEGEISSRLEENSEYLETRTKNVSLLAP
jgi:hypothetical protein